MVNKYSFWVQYSIEDECYLAFVYELPGLTAHGDTPDEALKEVQIALSGFMFLSADGQLGFELPSPETMRCWGNRPAFLKEKRDKVFVVKSNGVKRVTQNDG